MCHFYSSIFYLVDSICFIKSRTFSWGCLWLLKYHFCLIYVNLLGVFQHEHNRNQTRFISCYNLNNIHGLRGLFPKKIAKKESIFILADIYSSFMFLVTLITSKNFYVCYSCQYLLYQKLKLWNFMLPMHFNKQTYL